MTKYIIYCNFQFWYQIFLYSTYSKVLVGIQGICKYGTM